MVTELEAEMVRRKESHLDICLNKNVETHDAGFSDYVIASSALPEICLSDVNTSQQFLGTSFAIPLLIAGMTGGISRAQMLNEILAVAAEEANIPFGLGSQKIMVIDHSQRSKFDVRKVAPKVFLIGNIGAADLNAGISVDDIIRLVDTLELNAFAFHLNALQECIQPEGNTNFRNIFKVLEKVCRLLAVPVIVKEVGAGISRSNYERLASIGVRAVDVGGRGGTSWSIVEGHRGDLATERMGQLFSSWGVRTADAIHECALVRDSRNSYPEIVATGGIRDGIQVAKSVGLGATMCGVGLPFIKVIASAKSEKEAGQFIRDEIEFFSRSLRTAMFCSGAARLSEIVITPKK